MFYEIQTGGEKWDQQAKSMEDAIIAAFQRQPPEDPGTMTRIREWRGETRGKWHYVSTVAMLQAAGFSVSEVSKHE